MVLLQVQMLPRWQLMLLMLPWRQICLMQQQAMLLVLQAWMTTS
jgi:hypothetical protein